MAKDFKYLVLTQHFQSSPSEKYWVARMWFYFIQSELGLYI